MTTRLDEQRGERGCEEPAVGLQHAGEHDADAVERHLRREDAQHVGAELLGPPGTGSCAPAAAR